jgi:hypothetical protein
VLLPLRRSQGVGEPVRLARVTTRAFEHGDAGACEALASLVASTCAGVGLCLSPDSLGPLAGMRLAALLQHLRIRSQDKEGPGCNVAALVGPLFPALKSISLHDALNADVAALVSLQVGGVHDEARVQRRVLWVLDW